MVALPVVTDPAPVIDEGGLRLIMGGLSESAELAAPEAIGALPAVAIVAAGAKLETALLNNQHWDDFWIAQGARLNNVWHSLGNFLFHRGNAPSLDTVNQLIQLSMHVNMRAARQLVTTLASHSVAVESRLYKGVLSVAKGVDALQRWTVARTTQVQNQAHAELTTVAGSLERYADGKAHDALVGAHTLDAALRAELIRDVINPIKSDLAKLQHSVQTGAGSVASLSTLIHTHVLPELATATAAAAAAKALATKAQEWEDDCGEPMCETVGPKTNWGKLFKRFDAALLWALLAAIAAESPEEIEHAAEDFARLIGPPLDRWASSWLGLSDDDRAAATREVGGDVGSIPGIP